MTDHQGNKRSPRRALGRGMKEAIAAASVSLTRDLAPVAGVPEVRTWCEVCDQLTACSYRIETSKRVVVTCGPCNGAVKESV